LDGVVKANTSRLPEILCTLYRSHGEKGNFIKICFFVSTLTPLKLMFAILPSFQQFRETDYNEVWFLTHGVYE